MSIEIGAEAPPLRVDAEGVVRVGNTRVTLSSVVTAFTSGATADEVERYLLAQRERAAEIRLQNASKVDQKGIRERLLARRKKGS